MNYSDTSFFESNIDKINNYNTFTVHTGHHYFRILKSFTSSVPKTWNGNVFNKKDRVIHGALLDKFPLRFSLPKDALSKKIRSKSEGHETDPRIQHLVIMVNGLDEHKEYFLKQYDVLGASLAEKNIASVLLSTPFHLHRTVKYTDKVYDPQFPGDESKAKLTHNIFKPSDVIIDHWENIFSLYHTTYKDILQLIDKIRNPSPGAIDDDFNFYKIHFSRDTRISLLGYSLGGLIAFGCFLQNSSLIDKLILFNTPGSLKDSKPKAIRIAPHIWKDTIDKFTKDDERLENELVKERNLDPEYIRYFLRLMASRNSGPITTKIEDTKERILQIMCGADQVIDMRPWGKYFDQEEEDGLVKKLISQHIFSEVGHLPMMDPRGSELMPNICRLIADHILSEENQNHWQDIDIENKIMDLIKKTGFYQILMSRLDIHGFAKTFTTDDLEEMLTHIESEEDKKMFIKFYYLSKMYYPKLYDLLEKYKRD